MACLIVLGGLLAAGLAAAAPLPPPPAIPERSREYSWLERQRVRFRNSAVVRRANAAFEAHDLALAERSFQEALRNDPANNHLKLSLIRVYDQAGKAEAGMALCDELLRQYPGLLDAHLHRGYMALRAANYPVAAQSFERALQVAPADFSRMTEISRELVETYVRAGDPARAEEFGRRMLARQDSLRVRILLAESAMRRGAWTDAITHLDRAAVLARDPQDTALVAVRRGYVLNNLGRLQDADATLSGVLARPDLPAELEIEAAYELAQVARNGNDDARYFKLMDRVLGKRARPDFFWEYANRLYLAHRYEAAAKMFERSLVGDSDAVRARQTCMTIADLYLLTGRPEDARSWLRKALDYGPASDAWTMGMARVDYQTANYTSCVDRLLGVAASNDVTSLYLGFSFYQMGMGGLALHHMNLVRAPEALAEPEQLTFFSNRAYLNFDQDLYPEALADVDRALSIQRSSDMELVRIKTLMRLQRYREARDAGLQAERQLTEARVAAAAAAASGTNAVTGAPPALDGTLDARIAELIGSCSLRLSENDAAVRQLSDAIRRDPASADAYFLRGLAYMKAGKFKQARADFDTYQARVASVPGIFWGDYASAAGRLGEYDRSIPALTNSLRLYPVDVDALEESGYQNLKAARRPEARSAFRDAVETYSQVIPYLAGDEARAYSESRLAAKREYTKLDKTWSVQAYFSKTELNDKQEAPLATLEGALPSQAGLYAGYRPPVLGFRNERTLDVFARILANFERRSWRLDPDSYQGGAGAVYKPFRIANYATSFERLFKIGDNSEDNWLWRNMATWEHGEKPLRDRSWWPAARLYGEVSYYLDDERRWIYYLDGRAGPSFSVARKAVLTAPQGIAVARYQSNDETGSGTYTMTGVGANLRFHEREKELVTERWYMDVFGHYVWGHFRDIPDDLEKRSFDGLMFGVNVVK